MQPIPEVTAAPLLVFYCVQGVHSVLVTLFLLLPLSNPPPPPPPSPFVPISSAWFSTSCSSSFFFFDCILSRHLDTFQRKCT